MTSSYEYFLTDKVSFSVTLATAQFMIKMETRNGSSSTDVHIPLPAVVPPHSYEDIIKEWKEQISKVDKTMTSLANALDTMHATVCALTGFSKDQSSQDEESYKKGITEYTDDQRNALLFCIERTVVHNERFAMSSLREFLHVVINTLSRMSGSTTDIFEQLSLDTYLTQSHDEEICHVIYDKKLEKIEKENSYLKEKITSLSKQNAVYIEKENNLTKETDNLRAKNKTLEGYNVQLKSQRKESEQNFSKLRSKISVLEDEVHHYEKEKQNMRDKEDKLKTVTVEYERLQKEAEHVKKISDEYERLKNENEDVKEREVTCITLQNKLEDDKNEIDLLNNTIVELKKLNETEQQNAVKHLSDIEHLKKICERKDKELALYKSKAQEKADDLKRVQSELNKLNTKSVMEKQQYDREKEEATKLIDKHTKSINDLKSQVEKEQNKILEWEKWKRKYQQIEAEYKLAQQILQEKEEKEGEVEKILTSERHKHDDLKAEMTTTNRKNMQLQEEVGKLKLEINSLTGTIEIERENKELESKLNKELTEEVSSLCKENRWLQAEIENTSGAVQSLTSKNAQLTKDLCIIKQELELYKSKKVIQVQLYYQRRGELISTVEEELTCLLKSRIEGKGKLEVKFLKCANVSDVNPDIPLLLLCISASRIGTDAANTIQGLRLTPKVSLLIFHHKDEHALPNQASCQVLTGEEYTILGGIFDFAFLSGKGIYACTMNDSSVAKLVHFIKTESTATSFKRM